MDESAPYTAQQQRLALLAKALAILHVSPSYSSSQPVVNATSGPSTKNCPWPKPLSLSILSCSVKPA